MAHFVPAKKEYRLLIITAVAGRGWSEHVGSLGGSSSEVQGDC